MAKKTFTKEQVQRLVANPGERSKLATSVLQKYGYGDLVRKRLLQQRLDTPAVPGSTLTNRDVAHQANADTQLQYGSAQSLLARQAQQAPDYYSVYAKTLNDAAMANQAQAGQSAEAIQGLYRSGPNAPNSPQATIGTAQAGTASLLGEAEKNFLNRLAAGAVSQGIQSRNQYVQKGADLAREAGAFNVSDRAKIKAAEGQSVATMAVAGINQQKAATAKEQGQQRIDIQRKNSQTSATTAKTTQQTRDDTFAATHGGYSPAAFAKLPYSQQLAIIKDVAGAAHPKSPKGAGTGNPTSGPGSAPPALENKYVSQINRAAGYLTDGKLPAKDPKTGAVVYRKAKDRGEVIAWLKAHGADPNVIGVANSLAANNGQGLGSRGVRHAHALGIHVGGRWKIIPDSPRSGAQQSPH